MIDVMPAYLESGHFVGYVAYATASDLWLTPLKDDRDFSGRGWSCAFPDVHDLEWVVPRGDVAEPRLLCCLACSAIIPPPHDGYDYHRYGCCYIEGINPCACEELP